MAPPYAGACVCAIATAPGRREPCAATPPSEAVARTGEGDGGVGLLGENDRGRIGAGDIALLTTSPTSEHSAARTTNPALGRTVTVTPRPGGDIESGHGSRWTNGERPAFRPAAPANRLDAVGVR